MTDISIAAVDLLQELTDVESDEDNEDAINSFFDALVSITIHNFTMPHVTVYFFRVFL